MSSSPRNDGRILERFRPYLHVVARLRLRGEQQNRIDPFEMVQRTLFEASQQDRFQAMTRAEIAGWLRRILAHNLGEAFRCLHREESNTEKERPVPVEKEPVPQPGNQATCVLDSADVLASSLAQALVELPEPQREAIVLQYWHGMSLGEIGGRLNRTPVAVAGLLKRGLSRMRQLLGDFSATEPTERG
jgi:RNA polymerase sigma-70 factor (ECF subfamily)